MNKLKSIALQLPEYFLMIAVLFYWASTAVVLNPVAIVLLLALILQTIFKNRIVGFILSSLLILSCIYMLFALISELNEFPTFNTEAKKLLFIGGTYFITTMLVSCLMIFKYSQLSSVSTASKK